MAPAGPVLGCDSSQAQASTTSTSEFSLGGGGGLLAGGEARFFDMAGVLYSFF
jgi:hypothetical protein